MNKKYDITALGSVMMDVEYRVTDEFIEDYKLQKGVRTLVDMSKHRLFNKILSNGSNIVNIQPAGSACNTLAAATELGSNVVFCGKVGNDSLGQDFIDSLKKSGINFLNDKVSTSETGKCSVLITPDAQRTMIVFLGSNSEFNISDNSKKIICDSSWLYVEGYMLADQKRTKLIKDAIDLASKNGVKIALGLSDENLLHTKRKNFLHVLSKPVDLIFCNKSEAMALANHKTFESCKQALKNFAKTFVITDGAKGSIAYDGEGFVLQKGFRAKCINTNGAGDIFAGVFLHALCVGKSFEIASVVANAFASRLVEVNGPRLNKKDFAKIYRQYSEVF